MSKGPWSRSTPAIDVSIDLRGEVCPHPVMLTLDQLNGMEAGRILEVIVDCPSALVNIPVEVERHGHAMLGPPTRIGAEATMLVRAAGGSRPVNNQVTGAPSIVDGVPPMKPA